MTIGDYESEFGGGGQRHARADRVVRKIILDNSAASMSLLVPRHYTHLRLHFAGRGDVNAFYTTLRLRFATGTADSDFDDGAHYDWILVAGSAIAATATPFGVLLVDEDEGEGDDDLKLPTLPVDPSRAYIFSQFGGTSIPLGTLPGATTAARHAMTLSMDVPHYAGATFYKGWQSQAAYRAGNAQYHTTRSGQWKEIGPIRAVKVFAEAGNLIAGSMLMLEAS